MAEIPRGAIRFNTDSNKPELWDGSQWAEFQLSTPNLGRSVDSSLGARAVFPLGSNSFNQLDYVNTASTGNSVQFGFLSDTVYESGSVASSTRGVTAMSYTNPATTNILEFITLSSTGNSQDFGDLTQVNRISGAASNQTRGIFFAGGPSPFTNLIQYITIASEGVDAKDFDGNTLFSGAYLTACASPTRAVAFGGGAWPSLTNVIQFVNISTTGVDAQDFGDLTTNRGMSSASSNATRGVVMGGRYGTGNGANQNIIEYVTLSTGGNSVNFGDISAARSQGSGFASATRAFIAGGNSPSVYDTIEYVQISTQGNTTDFGNAGTVAFHSSGGGMSTGHGGL
jgi:hypothetical protein